MNAAQSVQIDPSSTLPEVIERAAERWDQCLTAGEGRTLLRLSILRDIMRELHAARSNTLAKGDRNQLPILKAWEDRIRAVRQIFPLDGDLAELLKRPTPLQKRTRLLPEALFSFIEREKLERYDRLWEGTLAAEACSVGWRFWSLEATVEIAQIEAWDRNLADQLWPHGLILFTETARGEAPFSSQTKTWRGLWITILHPNFRTPADLNVNVERWPGSETAGAKGAQWKLLFSPKRR